MFATLFKRVIVTALTLPFILMTTHSLAITSAEKQRIVDKFASVKPELVVSQVSHTDIEGMYLLNFSGQGHVYFFPKGNYFLTGELLKIDNKRFVNITEQQKQAPRKAALAKLNPQDMIVYPANGEQKASVTIFTDIDCGYCRKLHQEINQINDLGIEVRYLAYPRAGINSASYKKIVTAWCAKDKQDALTKLKNGQSIPTNVCKKNPVAEQFILGGRLGVKGTPAIIMESGEILPGYLPAKELAAAIGL